MTDYECPDCDWSGTLDDMGLVKHFHERVAPGELCPAGACPQCGALIDVANADVPDHVLDNCTNIMRARGWQVTVAKPARERAP